MAGQRRYMIGRESFMLIIHNIRSREWPDHGEEGFEEPEIEAGRYFVCVAALLGREQTTVLVRLRATFSRDEEALKVNDRSI